MIISSTIEHVLAGVQAICLGLGNSEYEFSLIQPPPSKPLYRFLSENLQSYTQTPENFRPSSPLIDSPAGPRIWILAFDDSAKKKYY